MAHFVNPRRFAECWQIDAAYPGTLAQQQAVRDAFQPTFGTPFHAFMQQLDRSINRTYLRSYMVIAFMPDEMWPPGMIATSGVTGISFRQNFDVTALRNWSRHEIGHVYDQHLMKQEDRTWFMEQVAPGQADRDWTHYNETFADAVRDCINGTAWQTLWPMLTREVHPLVQPGSESQPVQESPAAPPAPPVVAQVSPTEWGAAVNYDTKKWVPWNPDKWVVHYTGSTIEPANSVAAEKGRLRGIEEYHVTTKGWLGIAYNYAIGNTGTLYRCRGEQRSGATSGDVEPDGIPENQEAVAVLFIVGDAQQPSAAALTTFRNVWKNRQMNVIVHKDSTATSCPGLYLTDWVRNGGFR